MSDQPLFQKSDEQEAVYAPQQLPDGTTAASAAQLDEAASGNDAAVDTTVPAVAFAGGSNVGGMGPSVSTSGTASGVAPAAGLAGLTSDDEDVADR